MALTLAEAAKRETGDVIRQAIIQIYAESSPILRVLPFGNITGNALKYTREDTLPGIGFRGLNEGYTESVGVLNPLVETLTIAGGDLDVDKFITDTMGQDQRAAQEAMKAKKLAHTWHQKFIKGDADTDPKEFDGLQKRLTGDQVISVDTGTDGGALSLLKLDEAIDAVDEPTHLLMTKKMFRLLNAAARTYTVGGFVMWEVDEFGNRIPTYNNLPILEADPSDVSLAAIDEAEAYTGGGTADGTSIYVLNLREGMLQGIQNGGMDVRDLGELEAKPVFRTRIEWYSGIAMFHPRAAARLRDIDTALAVAA